MARAFGRHGAGQGGSSVMRALFQVVMAVFAFSASEAYAQSSERGSRQQLHDYFRCVAQAEKGYARRIVLGEPGALAEALNGGRFFRPNCVRDGRNATFAGLSFLDPMAEYILNRDYNLSDEIVWSDEATEVKAAMLASLAAARSDPSTQRQEKIMRELMGYCLLERNQHAAVQLLQTDIESEAEQQVVQALAADINVCLERDYPSELTFDELRGAIATARYRILHRAEHGDDDA